MRKANDAKLLSRVGTDAIGVERVLSVKKNKDGSLKHAFALVRAIPSTNSKASSKMSKRSTDNKLRNATYNKTGSTQSQLRLSRNRSGQNHDSSSLSYDQDFSFRSQSLGSNFEPSLEGGDSNTLCYNVNNQRFCIRGASPDHSARPPSPVDRYFRPQGFIAEKAYYEYENIPFSDQVSSDYTAAFVSRPRQGPMTRLSINETPPHALNSTYVRNSQSISEPYSSPEKDEINSFEAICPLRTRGRSTYIKDSPVVPQHSIASTPKGHPSPTPAPGVTTSPFFQEPLNQNTRISSLSSPGETQEYLSGSPKQALPFLSFSKEGSMKSACQVCPFIKKSGQGPPSPPLSLVGITPKKAPVDEDVFKSFTEDDTLKYQTPMACPFVKKSVQRPQSPFSSSMRITPKKTYADEDLFQSFNEDSSIKYQTPTAPKYYQTATAQSQKFLTGLQSVNKSACPFVKKTGKRPPSPLLSSFAITPKKTNKESFSNNNSIISYQTPSDVFIQYEQTIPQSAKLLTGRKLTEQGSPERVQQTSPITQGYLQDTPRLPRQPKKKRDLLDLFDESMEMDENLCFVKIPLKPLEQTSPIDTQSLEKLPIKSTSPSSYLRGDLPSDTFEYENFLRKSQQEYPISNPENRKYNTNTPYRSSRVAFANSFNMEDSLPRFNQSSPLNQRKGTPYIRGSLIRGLTNSSFLDESMNKSFGSIPDEYLEDLPNESQGAVGFDPQLNFIKSSMQDRPVNGQENTDKTRRTILIDLGDPPDEPQNPVHFSPRVNSMATVGSFPPIRKGRRTIVINIGDLPEPTQMQKFSGSIHKHMSTAGRNSPDSGESMKESKRTIILDLHNLPDAKVTTQAIPISTTDAEYVQRTNNLQLPWNPQRNLNTTFPSDAPYSQEYIP